MGLVAPDLWAAFALAALIVLVTPGPSTMLALAHGFRAGPGRAMATVAGIVSADLTHVIAVVFGMSALLAASVELFTYLKWAGVAYLVYLGIRYWRSPPLRLDGAPDGRSHRGRFAEGYLVTLTNPKPILFHIAFLPQFVDPALAQQPQLAVFGATFVLLAAMTLSGYAFFAGRLRGFFSGGNRGVWLNRLTGSLLIGAAGALAGLRR